MARRYQIKIYNVSHTTLIATLSDSCVIKGNLSQQLNGEDTLNFTVLKDHADATHVQKGRIARIVRSGDAWERSYRIMAVMPKRDGDKYEIEAKCEGLQYDLSDTIHPLSGSLIDQTPLTHMTQILSATSWTVGTITPTALVTMEYDYNSVMADLQNLREAASKAAGVEYDLEFTTTPGGAKTVSLKVVGVTSPTSSIEFAKNLLSLSYEDRVPEGNVVYGRGGDGSKGIPMTIGTATHRITAIAGNTITLDSRKVVSSNGTWNTSYSVEKPDGSLTVITGSVKQVSGNDQLTLTSAAGLAVDDAIRIVGNSGLDIDIVWDKDSVTAYGPRIIHFQDTNYTDVFNRLGPARLSTLSGTYTSGLCEGWAKIGNPTVTENTDAQYVINGTKSQKVVVGAFSSVPSFASVVVINDYADRTGIYSYKVSYVTDGGEGGISSATSNVSVADQATVITFNDTPPSTATHRRLYRNKTSGVIFYKISDIPIAQTTFYDTMKDSDLTVTPSGVNTAGGGEGISRTIPAVIGEEYSAVVYLYITTGRVRCFLSSGSEIFPKANLPDAERATKHYTEKTRVIVVIPGFQAKSSTITLNIVGHDGDDTFYVDSAMLVKSAYPPPEDKFVADNSATELFHKTYDRLQTSKDANLISRLAMTFADLREAGIGSDLIDVGDKVNVTDTKLSLSFTGANAPRVVRKNTDIVRPWNGDVEINSAIPRFTDDLYARRRSERQTTRSLARSITRTSEDFRAQIETSRNPMVIIKELAD